MGVYWPYLHICKLEWIRNMFKRFYARARAAYREIVRRDAVRDLELWKHRTTIRAAHERTNSEVLRKKLEELYLALYGTALEVNTYHTILFEEEITASKISADMISAGSLSDEKISAGSAFWPPKDKGV